MVEGTPEGRAFDCVINYASEASNTPVRTKIVAKLKLSNEICGLKILDFVFLKNNLQSNFNDD